MKHLLVNALLLLALPAQAFSWFDGLYVGVSGGVTHQQIGLDTVQRQGTIRLLESNNKVASTTGWGEVFGGWGEYAGRWLYWGVRFGGNFSTYDFVEKANYDSSLPAASVISNLDQRIQVKLCTAELTADFKPGFILNPSMMLFGYVGVALNQTTLNGRGRLQDNISNPSVTALGSNQHRRAALRLGVGFEKSITQQLALNASYVYTRYQKITTEGAAPSTVGLVNFASQASPRKAVASLGLGYYF